MAKLFVISSYHNLQFCMFYTSQKRLYIIIESKFMSNLHMKMKGFIFFQMYMQIEIPVLYLGLYTPSHHMCYVKKLYVHILAFYSLLTFHLSFFSHPFHKDLAHLQRRLSLHMHLIYLI